jgi:Co/Zn/Cd efflux system component
MVGSWAILAILIATIAGGLYWSGERATVGGKTIVVLAAFALGVLIVVWAVLGLPVPGHP